MPGSTFLWGLLALCQMTLLPGYLLTRALRLRAGVVESLLVAFGLSTLVNYVLIHFLVFLRLYTRSGLLAVIAVELVAIFLLWRRGPDSAASDVWKRSLQNYRPALEAWPKLPSIERAAVLGIGLFTLYCLFSLAHAVTAAWPDSAFVGWDTLFSWNRWATAWFNNSFPHNTFRYPQLLPANSSIAYTLMGTNVVQAFSRLFYAVFPIALFVALIDLGIRRRQLGFWVAVPLAYFAWAFMPPPGPAEGYADVPVTFMILMTVYCALVADEQETPALAARWMLAAGLFAGAALVTKQTGLFAITTLPAILWLLVGTGRFPHPRHKREVILWSVAAAILVSVPWYLFKEIQIRLGRDNSEVIGVVIAHGGRGLLGRIANGAQLCCDAWGVVPTALVATLAVTCAFLRTPWRWVTLLIVIPGAIAWSATTSYDLRNSNFFVILGCISAGVTVGHLMTRASAAWRPWPAPRRRAAVAAAVVCAAVALSFLPTLSHQSLRTRSDRAQRLAALPDLNAALIRLVREGKITRPILTNYHVMPFVPVIRKYVAFDGFDDPAAFREKMDAFNPQYIAVVHPRVNYPALSQQVVAENVAAGRWSVYESGGSFQIIQVHPTPLPASQRSANFAGFRVVSGLGLEERPYADWDLPLVRWGQAPATVLEFDAAADSQPFELSLEIHPPKSPRGLDVVLNGTPVARAQLNTARGIKTYKFPLTAKPGVNRLELRYDTWDAHGPNRDLAVLFSAIRIVP